MLRRLMLASDTTECSAYQALTQRLLRRYQQLCVLKAKRAALPKHCETNGKLTRVCVCMSRHHLHPSLLIALYDGELFLTLQKE